MDDERSRYLTRLNAALRVHHDLLFDDNTGSIKSQFAESVNCPVCDSEKYTLFFEKDGFHYARCSSCSMVYMNPRLNTDANYAFYNSNANAIYNETKFDGISSATALDDKINFENLDIIEKYRHSSRGKILEIGCAKGFFLKKAKDRGYEVYGIELNEKNYLFAKKSFGETIYSVDLFAAHFENETFDVIYMRDVIEHIPNPKSFLEELARIAKPGSLLFIETHNIDGLINRIVREKHTVIFGFEHPNHWSPKTLGMALNRCGFNVKDVIHKSLDFTILEIIRYFSEPSFTTIYPWSASKNRRILLRMVRLPFKIPFARQFDVMMTPKIANAVKYGSVMKIIAEKPEKSNT